MASILQNVLNENSCRKMATSLIRYLKFAFFWLFKGNQYEFLTYPKIKGGLEPPTSGLPVHCSTT